MKEPGENPALVDPAKSSHGVVPCDICGGPTYELRCKIICRRCGFTRDCSDP